MTKKERKAAERRARKEAKGIPPTAVGMAATVPPKTEPEVGAPKAREGEHTKPVGDYPSGDRGQKVAPSKWADRVVVGCTVVLALAAIAQCILVKYQWDAMEDQLREIKGTAAQTDEIIKTYAKANELTQKAIQLNQDGLALNKETLELTRHSVNASLEAVKAAQIANEISKRNADSTQALVESTQGELALAQKGYDISNKALVRATTPWVGISIKGIRLGAHKSSLDKWVGAEDLVADLVVDYELTNFSDNPAIKIFTTCRLGAGDTGIDLLDISGLGDSQMTIMPKQSINGRLNLLVRGKQKPDFVKSLIETGAFTIKTLVSYQDTLSNRTNFIVEFREMEGGFKITNIEHNPTQQRIDQEVLPSIRPPNK